MRFSSALFAFAAAGLIAASPVTAAAADVLVVDFGRIYATSLAGKDAQSKLRNIGDSIEKELQPEVEAVRTEQQKLGPRFKDKTREQVLADLRADQALAATYTTYAQKAQTLEQKLALRQQELQATEQRALEAVVRGSEPILQEMLKERNADAILQANTVIIASPGADITQEVISRLDQRLKAVAVTKVDLVAEQKAAQQRAAGQQPRPNAQR